ncbi:MAG: hypothetical protein AAFX93_15065 [Verrucomicrobiota bacterium]
MRNLTLAIILCAIVSTCVGRAISSAEISKFTSKYPLIQKGEAEAEIGEQQPRLKEAITALGKPIETLALSPTFGYMKYESDRAGFYYLFMLNGHDVRDQGIENYYIVSIVLTNLSDIDIHVYGVNFVDVNIDDNEYYSSILVGNYLELQDDVPIAQRFKAEDELEILLRQLSESATYNDCIEILGHPYKRRGIFIYYESEIPGWEYVFRFRHKSPEINKNLFSLPPHNSSGSDLLLDWVYHTNRVEWHSLTPEGSFMRLLISSVEEEIRKEAQGNASDSPTTAEQN